jgi:hypothetical protein
MTSQNLYDGFRPYVYDKNLDDYDNEFSCKKRRSNKFMIEFIHKYIDLDYYHKHPKQQEDAILFNYFLFEFSQKFSKTTKAIEDFRETPKHASQDFLFSDPSEFFKKK